jgi:hypothetical protein
MTEHTIYMWSTERYKDETQRTKDGKYFPVLAKVGETKEYRAEVRVAQTDSTGVAETPMLLKQWHIPAQYRDKYLHALLAKKGYPKNRDDKDREWIYFTGCKSAENAIEVMDRLLNEVLTGKSAITNYPLFDYQQKIVDWAVDRYKQGDESVLINAIMRAGKCMISHAIVRALKFKRVLIVTAKPGAIDSWSVLARGGEEEHVDYCNYIFHDYDNHKRQAVTFDQGDCDIVACSLQFANRHIDGGNVLMDQILATDWDLIIFDEQHYATSTEKTKKFLSSLKTKFKIELSGTPYKTLLSNRFSEDSVYSFDYIDEQKIRDSLLDQTSAQAEQFKFKARINWALIQIPDKIKLMLNEENFNLGGRGLFATQDDALVYRDAVNELINLVRLRGYKNLPGQFDNIVEKVTKHSLWVLPKNVKAIKLFAEMLSEHPYFKKYDVVVATGSTDENIATVKDINDVKNRIAAVETGKSDYVGTITLTCGRFLEGTSVPEWWSVHQINDSKSAEDYFQGCFRCKTPWGKGDKQEVIVFDYNPERFVSVMYQHIERKADATGRKTEEVADEFTNCSDVYDFGDNDWNVISGCELQTRFLSDIKNYTDRVGNLVRAEAIDATIASMLSGLKEDANATTAKSQFNSNELLRGSNRKMAPLAGQTKKEQEAVEDAEAQLRYALKQIYELINISWAEGEEINCIEDVINSSDIELVYNITGLTPSQWRQVSPAVDVIGMNRAIGQYNAF